MKITHPKLAAAALAVEKALKQIDACDMSEKISAAPQISILADARDKLLELAAPQNVMDTWDHTQKGGE